MTTLGGPPSALTPKIDPSGKVITATFDTAPEPTYAPRVSPQVESGAPEAGFDLTPEQFSQATGGDVTAGEYVPETFQEGQQALEGSFGSSVKKGLSDGLIGYMTYTRNLEQQDKDRLEFEAANYAADNGFKSFVGESLGGIVSDAPIDLALAFTTAGLGNAIQAAGKGANVASKAVLRMGRGVDAIRDAYKGGGKLSSRLARRGVYEGSVGAASALISEGLQAEMGKDASAEDIANRVFQEGVASVFLAEAFRAAGKPFKKMTASEKNKVASEIANDIKEDTGVIVDPARILESVEQKDARANAETFKQDAIAKSEQMASERFQDEAAGGPALLGEATTEPVIGAEARTAAQAPDVRDFEARTQPEALRGAERDDLLALREEAGTDRFSQLRESADNIESRIAEIDELDLRVAQDNVKTLGSKESLTDAFGLLLKEEDAHLADSLSTLFTQRAKAAGMNLKSYLEAKGLDFRNRPNVALAFKEGANILEAPVRAANAGDLLHDIGHIFRSDLTEPQVRSLEGEYGIVDGKWDRAAEERWADDFVRYVNDGILPKTQNKGLLKQAFDDLKDWIQKVYGELSGDFGVATRRVLDDLFNEGSFRNQKVTKEGQVAAQKARADQGIRKLKAEGSTLNSGEKIQKYQKDMEKRVKKDISDYGEDGADSYLGQDAGRIPRFLGKVGGLLGSHNLLPVQGFEALGKAGTRIANRFEESFSKEKGVIVDLFDGNISAAKDAGFDKGAVKDLMKTSRELTFVDKEGKSKSVELPTWELYTLHKYAAETSVDNPASQKLTRKGYRNTKGDVMTFLPSEVDRLGTKSYLDSLGEGASKLDEVIKSGFKASADIQNKLSRKRTGEDAFPESSDYFPNRTLTTDTMHGKDIVKAIAKDSFGKGSKTNLDLGSLFSFNFKRKGDAILLPQNPIAALLNQQRDVARMVGFTDSLLEARLFLLGSEGRIKENMGDKYFNGLNDNLDNILEPNRAGDPLDNKIASRLLKAQATSALAANLTAGMKTMSSELATNQRIPRGIMASYKGMDPKVTRKYAIDKYPVVKDRLLYEGPFAGLEESNISGGVWRSIFGDEGGDIGKSLGPVEAASTFAEDLMLPIRKGDEKVTLDAVSKAEHWSLKENPKLKGDARTKDVNQRIANILIEGQPTSHPITRTINQNSKSFVVRSIVQFSSQTTKNITNALVDIQKANKAAQNAKKDPSNDSLQKLAEEARKNAFRTMKLLGLQMAMVAGIGAGMSEARNLAFGSLKSKRAKRRLERFRKESGGLSSRVWDQVFRTSLGHVPVAGGTLAGWASAGTGLGSGGFDLKLMPLEIPNSITEWLNEGGDLDSREFKKVQKNFLKAIGAPNNFVRAGYSIAE